MSKKILVIGAGPTCSLIAYKLGELNFKVPLDIYIWEGSSSVGGRFSTTRNPHDQKCFADLGAQWLTHNRNRIWSKIYFDHLSEHGLIQKFSTSNIGGFRSPSIPEEKDNYVCTEGMATVVNFFLNKANVNNISFNKSVLGLKIIKNFNAAPQVEVTSNDAQAELFDVVISTLPVPQLLQLKNVDVILDNLHSEVKVALANVSYTSRYGLGLFYKSKLELKSDERGMNYVDNDPVIRYWTVENEKRAFTMGTPKCQDETHSSVVVHTTVKFGAENIEKDIQETKELLLKQIDGRFQTLQGMTPDYVTLKKWRYSQVDLGYVNAPGYVELSSSPVILAAGDGFSYSGIEGCILSAEKTVEKLSFILEQT